MRRSFYNGVSIYTLTGSDYTLAVNKQRNSKILVYTFLGSTLSQEYPYGLGRKTRFSKVRLASILLPLPAGNLRRSSVHTRTDGFQLSDSTVPRRDHQQVPAA